MTKSEPDAPRLPRQWHYVDAGSGTRVGPVELSVIEKLIADQRLQRTALVWNPDMPEWAKASSTELSTLFGATPPPVPASSLSSWPVYTATLMPIWGGLVVANLSNEYASSLGMTTTSFYFSPYWYLLYAALNITFGVIDYIRLEKAGISVRRAGYLSMVLIAIYLFVRGRVIKKSTQSSHLAAYLPLYVWCVATAVSFAIAPGLLGQN